MYIIELHPECSGDQSEACCPTSKPSALLLLADLKFSKEFPLLTTPKKDKSSQTLWELSSWAASESSASWEICPAKSDGESKISLNNSKARELKELKNGTSKELHQPTPLEKPSTKNKSPKLEINWLNSDIDYLNYFNFNYLFTWSMNWIAISNPNTFYPLCI